MTTTWSKDACFGNSHGYGALESSSADVGTSAVRPESAQGTGPAK